MPETRSNPAPPPSASPNSSALAPAPAAASAPLRGERRVSSARRRATLLSFRGPDGRNPSLEREYARPGGYSGD